MVIRLWAVKNQDETAEHLNAPGLRANNTRRLSLCYDTYQKVRSSLVKSSVSTGLYASMHNLGRIIGGMDRKKYTIGVILWAGVHTVVHR